MSSKGSVPGSTAEGQPSGAPRGAGRPVALVSGRDTTSRSVDTSGAYRTVAYGQPGSYEDVQRGAVGPRAADVAARGDAGGGRRGRGIRSADPAEASACSYLGIPS